MRAFTLGVTLAIAFGAAPAMAQDSDSAKVSVTGQVAKLCVLGTPSSAVIDLGQMANTSGARVGKRAAIANKSVTLPGSFCNFANSVVTVSATALTADDATAAQPGFARAVNFTATASNWAATDAVATTSADEQGAGADASGSGSVQGLPKLADIGLTLSGYDVPGDKLLVSGGYTGSVTVTLAPEAAPAPVPVP
ncbi:MAG TPA: hypothetical protein VFP14_11275 [Novosphingobium sp.]|nr:hypothetical protein [Novosphingobium sp.]